jgi:hypothetical protein
MVGTVALDDPNSFLAQVNPSSSEATAGGNAFVAGLKAGAALVPDPKPNYAGALSPNNVSADDATRALAFTKGASSVPYVGADVRPVIYSAWTNQGATPNAVAGVMANVSDESSFNPTLRHPDQPRYGGEAHYAHGLYQEGGAEYNRYASWLTANRPGTDWRDPQAQSDFAAWNLKNNYPGTWARMNAAATPGEAASIYINEYLKPAEKFRAQRSSKYRRGVPSIDAWMGSTKGPY